MLVHHCVLVFVSSCSLLLGLARFCNMLIDFVSWFVLLIVVSCCWFLRFALVVVCHWLLVSLSFVSVHISFVCVCFCVLCVRSFWFAFVPVGLFVVCSLRSCLIV